MGSKIWVGLILGTIGGFLGWFLQEHMIDYNAHIVPGLLPGQGNIRQSITSGETFILTLTVGGCIGLFLGAVDGIVSADKKKILTGLAVGAFAGIVLGSVGLQLGSLIYNLLGGSNIQSQTPNIITFSLQVFARSMGWAMMGVGFGAGSAIITRSPKRILNGAIGGLIGGLIGGFVFDMVANAATPVSTALGASGARDVGGPSRMIGFTLIGGLTGFFIGLVEELLKQAWVKVLAGRNEGKDFILYKDMNLFGRDERCDVPLFGDTSVGVQHAAIRTDGKRHFLLAADTPVGTHVNGQQIAPNVDLLLRDGDMLQMGTHRILFHEKATASRLVRPNEDLQSQKSKPGALQMPSHLCSFCGSPRDRNGHCKCSLAEGDANLPATGMLPQSPINYDIPPAYSPSSQPAGYAQSGGASTAMMDNYSPPNFAVAFKGQLSGVEGPYSGQVFFLSTANMVVGREPGRDIVLIQDTTVSRTHAQIVQQGGSYLVFDNNSSNGTFVNGQRVASSYPLNIGDIVQFGSSKFRFE